MDNCNFLDTAPCWSCPSSAPQDEETPAKRSARQLDFRLKYKTEICKGWQAGFCRFGEHCAFAHGPWELRDKLADVPRRGPCRQYAGSGVCSFGDKCQFSHSPGLKDGEADDEARTRSRLSVFVDLANRAHF